MLSNTCPHCGKDRGNSADVCPQCEAKVENKDATKSRSFAMIIVPIICILGVSLVFWTMANYRRAHADGSYTLCQQNVKEIGVALELYSADHQLKYPARLHDLVPRYLKSIPTCPQVHKDTCSSSYVCSRTMKEYTFYCKGNNHPRFLEPDYPQYNSREGLKIHF